MTKTPDDGHRRFPKHVEFYDKNTWWWAQKMPETCRVLRQNTPDDGHRRCPKHVEFYDKNSWWWAQKMPETCRVLWQNKIWIFDASSWLFCTKQTTDKFICLCVISQNILQWTGTIMWSVSWRNICRNRLTATEIISN